MQRDVRPPPWLAQDVAWPSGKLLRAVLPDMDLGKRGLDDLPEALAELL